MNVLHLGAYERNIGDSVALENIRLEFPEYNWKSLDIQHPNATKKILEQDYDLLLIGGGGLIEGGNWNKNKYSWKLPFTETEIKMIEKPIVVFAVGLNFFRGMEKLNPKGIKNLQTLIEQSRLFSVRNDFSGIEIKQYYSGDKVQIIPDPGVIQKEVSQKKILNKILFSPAINSNGNIMAHRKIDSRQIVKIAEKLKCDCIAHTGKDFIAGVNHIISYEKLSAAKFPAKVFNKYDNYDLVIAMRGHAQLVAYGKGIPCIALSSQNKLAGFYTKVGMEDYTIDTERNDWMNILMDKVEELKNNPQRWYDIRFGHIGELRDKFYNFCKQIRNINGTA